MDVIPLVVGLGSVVVTMSVGGGLLQERSRWLPAALWVLVLVVGASIWSLIVGPRPVWSGFSHLHEQAPNVTLVGIPSLLSLAALLFSRHRSLPTRIAVASAVGLVGAVAAPLLALWVACGVTGDCL